MNSVDEIVAALSRRRSSSSSRPTPSTGSRAARTGRSAVRALSALKRRSAGQPIALVAASVDALAELRARASPGAAVALRGPFTLVVPNPARRLPWLTGARPDTIGVRIPDVAGRAAELFGRVGVIAATSANLHGGTDPRRARRCAGRDPRPRSEPFSTAASFPARLRP